MIIASIAGYEIFSYCPSSDADKDRSEICMYKKLWNQRENNEMV